MRCRSGVQAVGVAGCRFAVLSMLFFNVIVNKIL